MASSHQSPHPSDFVELELALDDDDPLCEAKFNSPKGPWFLNWIDACSLQASIQLRVFDLSTINHKLWLLGFKEQCKCKYVSTSLSRE